MSIKKAEDVVILGGGVFGFSIAYHLAREGISSQVIEMDSIGAKASGKADGMIGGPVSTYFFSRGALRPALLLSKESYLRFQQLHLELKEETGLDIQYAIEPSLMCALSEEKEKILISRASAAKKEGLDLKLISGDEARSLEEALTPEVRMALLRECAQVEPYRYTLALAQGAENLGACIRSGRAVGFRCDGNRVKSVLLSSGKEVVAGTVVIAMGPWSGQAVSWLGISLPIHAIRAQTLRLESPKRPRHQIGFVPAPKKELPNVFMMVSPRVDGSLLVGYTEDITETWDNNRPETWADFPTNEMKELIVELALETVPMLKDAVLVEQRAAVLGYPPDRGMVIGPVPDWKNAYMAMIGDGGIGLSPAVGRVMTDLINGGDRAKKAVTEVESLSLMRFMS